MGGWVGITGMAKEIGPRPRRFSNAGGSALESRMGCFHAVRHECYCSPIGFRVALASCKKNLFLSMLENGLVEYPNF